MPAPTYKLTQEIPECSDSGGGGSESNFDSGNIVIHASCCRTYGVTVGIGGLVGVFGTKKGTLNYEGSVSTCSNTGAGAKVYSSNAYRLCGHQAGPFTGRHQNGVLGIISGASFSGSGQGNFGSTNPASVIKGPYQISFSGTFSSPGNGSFTGTITGAAVGTFVGTITGGVIDVAYTFTSPQGATATDNGNDSFTITGGGTRFSFVGDIVGTVPPPIEAYLKLTWTHCNRGGLLLEELNSADDSLIADYTNSTYSVKHGVRTMLNRKSVSCSHPCIVELDMSQKNAFALHPPQLCFFPATSMSTCLGGTRDKEYTATVSGASTPLSAMDGATGTGDWQLVGFSASGNVSPTFSLTGTLEVFYGPNPGSYPGVTVSFSGGDNLSGGGGGAISPCKVLINSTIEYQAFQPPSFGTTSVSFAGGGLPGYVTALALPIRISLVSWGAPTTVSGSPTHDFCGGDLVLSPTSPIVVDFGIPGSTVQFRLTTAPVAVTLTLTQSGDAYP